ncbi:MAG: MBL fold metallo-hydrolase [Spirochaetia bacterium]|nr:MBL fold metallo-hydrolase [Spirochaetia bacterium]MBQ3647248.1 MBL fold metallo-hydrolase [Spirochaetia bacterium]MBQ3712332.1 MBL fold metallo-hydrolase [Spirochaetia bacterium]
MISLGHTGIAMTLLFCLSAMAFADTGDYGARAANFDGKKFNNEHEFVLLMKDVPKDAPTGVLSDKETVPGGPLPLKKPDFSGDSSSGELFFTWFGHSTLLIQMSGRNIMFDPVFSLRSSPVQFAGPKRFTPPPCTIADLPEIDIVIISHDHYDHLDKWAIKQIDSKVKKYVCPLGVEKRLIKFGVDANKITNMAWWEEIQLEGIDIACTPARHFSGRSLTDRFETLWAGWVLSDGRHKIFESGDSGWDTHFQRIGAKYGSFDLAFIEAGQYDIRWPSVHMKPEESFDAAKAVGAKHVVPIHWGTFRLARHPWDDSVQRMVKAAGGSGIKIITPYIGETVPFSNILNYQNRWYEPIR